MEDLNSHIGRLREDFTYGRLEEQDASHEPSVQFAKWMKEAVDAAVPEVQAASLATVSREGKPSSRIVYLREFGKNRYWFYTNYNSRKSAEMLGNPHVALTFFWPALQRQIRIEGTVTKSEDAASDNYFNTRPFESQVGAWASAQSSVIASRDELEGKVRSLQEQMAPGQVQRPPHWGGFVITAGYYEFWQGRKSRLHDRLAYTFQAGEWHRNRLAP